MTTKLQTVERGEYPTADDFLAKSAALTQDLDVPELGFKVKIKQLGLADRKVLNAAAVVGGVVDDAMFQACTVVMGMVHPKLEQAAALKLKEANPLVVDRIAKAIWKFSGLSNTEAAKND